MDITQTFYDNMAAQYDKLFFDWQAATNEQAIFLDRIFAENGFDRTARREELTNLLLSGGCRKVTWRFPEETGFYQPIVIAEK